MGKSEYRKAIMQTLDKSDHFILVLSDISFLESNWVKEESEVFHSEIREGRKHGSNFIFLVTEKVMTQIKNENKKCLPIDFRRYEIMLISEMTSKLKEYIK